MRFSTLSVVIFIATASASSLNTHLTRRQEAEDALAELYVRDAHYSGLNPRDAEAYPIFGNLIKKIGGGISRIVGLRRREALEYLAAGGDPELLARSLEWSEDESDGLNVREFDEDLYAREFYDQDLA